MRQPRHIIIVLLLLTAIIQQANHYSATAQDEAKIVYSLIFRTNNEVWSVDLVTGTQNKLLQLEEDPQKYYFIEMDKKSEYAYVISREQGQRGTMHEVQYPTILPSQITQYNIQTLEKEVIYEANNLLAVTFSPDEQYAIVSYFRPEMPLLRTFCAFHLSSQTCTESNISVDTRYLIWLDETRFFTRLIDNGIQIGIIYNIQTMDYEILETYRDWNELIATSLSDRNHLLITGISASSKWTSEVYIFDTKTHNSQDITAQFPNLTHLINNLESSPDGKYVAYRQVQTYIIQEVETAENIGEFLDVIDIEWLPNSKEIIALLDKYPAEYNQLVMFNVQTQEKFLISEILGRNQMIIKIIENEQ